MADAKWTTQADNHNFGYDEWLPHLLSAQLDAMVPVENGDGTVVVLHWYRRDNVDLLPYRVTFWARGDGDVQVHAGAASSAIASVNSPGAYAKHTVEVVPVDATGPATIEVNAGPGDTMEIQGVVIQYDSVLFTAGKQPSGAVYLPAGLLTTADNTISTEHLARLANQPGQLARARPMLGGAMHKFAPLIAEPANATYIRDAVVLVAGQDRSMTFDIYCEGSFTSARFVLGGGVYDLALGWTTIGDVMVPRGVSSGDVMFLTKAAFTGQCRAIQAWRR